MSLISKPNTFSPNTTISSSQMNDNFDTIYNEFNGSISEANLADSAVTADKIADSAVTTAKVADAAITGAKVNFAATGADGIWWEELGRTTLGSAGDTISVTGLSARKYLKIIVVAINSGVISPTLRFNNDSGNNYAYRFDHNNGGTIGNGSSLSSLGISQGNVSAPTFAEYQVIDIANQEKQIFGFSMNNGAAGAGNLPSGYEFNGKWANTSDQITRVDIVNAGAGDFAAGSEVIVLGHD